MYKLGICAVLIILAYTVVSIGLTIQNAMFADKCKAADGIVIGQPLELKCATGIEYIDLSTA